MKTKEKWQIIRRSLRTAYHAEKGFFPMQLLQTIILTTIEMIDIFLVALVVDSVASGKSMQTILFYAGIVVGVYLILWLLRAIAGGKENTRKFCYTQNVHKTLWSKALDMDYTHLESAGTQNQYRRAQNQIEDQNTGLQAAFHQIIFFIDGIFMIVFGCVLLFPTALRKPVINDGFVGLVQSVWGLIIVAFLVIALELLKTKVNKQSMKIIETIRNDETVIQGERIENYYSQYVFDNYRNGKDIRIFDEQGMIIDECEKCHKMILQQWRKVYWQKIEYEIIFQGINILTKVFMYGFAIVRALTGMLTPGEVIAFVLYFAMISAGISQVSESYGLLMITPPFCKHYFDFLDIPDNKYQGTIPTEKRDDNAYEFEFKHVWFRYPKAETYVL